MVVGLPYANSGSVELQERMKYVSRQQKLLRGVDEKNAASELYTNMCMNAVNQSIGEPSLYKSRHLLKSRIGTLQEEPFVIAVTGLH